MSDQQKALAVVVAVVALSALARLGPARAALELEGAGADLDSLTAEAQQEVEREALRSRPLEPGERLDPNTAGEDELARLPGVGLALARRIVEGRPYRRLEDLDRVPGIGPAMLVRIGEHLRLESGQPASGPRREESGGRGIDLNRAGAAELERLPGIGPALAAQIVAYRDSAGRFRSWEEVDRVPGIGPAKLARIRENARLQP